MFYRPAMFIVRLVLGVVFGSPPDVANIANCLNVACRNWDNPRSRSFFDFQAHLCTAPTPATSAKRLYELGAVDVVSASDF
jgi:hypothetical protein